MKLALLLVGLAVACCSAQEDLAAVEVDAQYHANLPNGWAVKGRSPRTETIELVFAVKQQNIDELEKALLSVSDPTSEQYGKHLSNEQVHDLVAPTRSDVSTVVQYLSKAKLAWKSASRNNDFIKVDVTVQQAEELLNTEYYEYAHKPSGHSVHRVKAYHLPQSIQSKTR